MLKLSNQQTHKPTNRQGKNNMSLLRYRVHKNVRLITGKDLVSILKQFKLMDEILNKTLYFFYNMYFVYSFNTY